MASAQGAKDKLISTVFDTVRCLPTSKQAAILSDTSPASTEVERCGILRQSFLRFSSPSHADTEPKSKISSEFISKRPGEAVTKALLARGAARQAAAERLMVKAQQGTYDNPRTTSLCHG
jgi:hypothetical protein